MLMLIPFCPKCSQTDKMELIWIMNHKSNKTSNSYWYCSRCEHPKRTWNI